MPGQVLLIDLWPDPIPDGGMRERFEQLPIAATAAGIALRVAHHREIEATSSGQIAGIILSGSQTNLVDDPAEDPVDGAPLSRFNTVLALLDQAPEVPVLGICFGHQLLAKAGGGRLERMPATRYDGHFPVEPLMGDALLAGIPPHPAFAESHAWRVAEPATGYQVVARSADGIEMVRHLHQPRVGVQFHPEYYLRQAEGERWGQRFLANWFAQLPTGRS